MVSTLLPLVLALAPQSAPAQAVLHPGDATLYVEVGDMQGLLKAYEGAPLFRLINDERIKSLITEAGLPLDASPEGLIALASARAMPGADLAPLVKSLRGASLSIAVRPGGPMPVAVQAVLAMSDAGQASSVRDMLVGMAPHHEPVTSTLPGVQRIWGVSPEQGGWLAVTGSNLVFGGGALTLEEFAGRSSKPGDSFAAHWKSPAAFSDSSGTNLGWFAFQSSPTLVAMLSGLGPWMQSIPPEMNPFDKSFTGRMRMVGDRFVTELFGTDKSDDRPVDSSWLALVPETSMMMIARAFDGVGVGAKLRAAMSKDPLAAAQLQAVEDKIGFGPERVLSHLGPGMTMSLMPLAGLGLPESRMMLDCEDPAAFQSDLEKLVGALAEIRPGFEVKSRPYKVKNAAGERVEYPIVTLTLPPEMGQLGPMIALSPSYTVVGKRLVFALNSLDIKSELKRLYGEDAQPIDAARNPLTTNGMKLPAGATTVVLMDWAKMLKGIYDSVKPFLSMQPDAIPFDINKLPPSDIFAQYLSPTFFYSVPVEGGQYRRNEASFGPEILAAVAAGAGYTAMTRINQAAYAAPPAPVQPVTSPSGSSGDEDDGGR